MKKETSSQSRRVFIKKSSFATAGIALSPAILASTKIQEKDKIRIGIAGGSFGAGFQWHEHPDCIVEAVAELRADRLQHLAQTYNCSKTYTSLEKMVKDPNIDAIGVFTPGPLHVQHAIEALRHGKHVISAVPACWGSVEDANRLLEVVKETGLTYMLAETSYYQQTSISVRKLYNEGKFGNLYQCNSFYHHDGLERIYFDHNGKRTWRYGMPPMWYPTHCTAHLLGITGGRLTEVSCHGWGDGDPIVTDNAYGNNPFWNETALFKSDSGQSFNVDVWWKGAHMGEEKADWIGDKMSFYGASRIHGSHPKLVHRTEDLERDDAGFIRSKTTTEDYPEVKWYETDLLPKPLRHNSGHEGSHTFITHEFIDAIKNGRRPSVDIYEALNYTVPGIIAHESALRGGEILKIPQFIRPTD